MKNLRGVTLVTTGVLAGFALFLLPMLSKAQTTGATAESLKNSVSGPINDLIGPLQSLKDQITTKATRLGGNPSLDGAKGFLEKNGINTNSATSMLQSLTAWFTNVTNSVSSPTFITWAVDFIKRIFLMIIELLSKIVNSL